jgi:hypothetical protein
MEDHLSIQEPSTLNGEEHTCPLEFRQENGDVEATNVETRQVARFQELGESPGPSGEGRFVGYVLVGDTMYGGGFRRYRDSRIEAAYSFSYISLGGDPDDCELHDPVRNLVEAGRFQIQEGQRAGKIKRELHGATSSGETAALPRRNDSKGKS